MPPRNRAKAVDRAGAVGRPTGVSIELERPVGVAREDPTREPDIPLRLVFAVWRKCTKVSNLRLDYLENPFRARDLRVCDGLIDPIQQRHEPRASYEALACLDYLLVSVRMTCLAVAPPCHAGVGRKDRKLTKMRGSHKCLTTGLT